MTGWKRRRGPPKVPHCHEAAGAELEIVSEGIVVSRAWGNEFYRARIGPEHVTSGVLRFEKAPSQPVLLRLVERDALVAEQPGKPNALFRRVRPE